MSTESVMSSERHVDRGTNISYHPQFATVTTRADSVVVLRSSDDTYYCMPAIVLRTSTRIFRDMLQHEPCTHDPHVAPIPISVPSRILTPILLMLSGRDPSPSSSSVSSFTSTSAFPYANIADLEEALTLLREWEAPGPIYHLRSWVTTTALSSIASASVSIGQNSTYVASEEESQGAAALILYGVASRHGWEDEAKILSERTLGLDLWNEKFEPLLKRIDSMSLMRLLRLRRTRRDRFKILVEDTSVSWFTLSPLPPLPYPTAEAECTSCQDALRLGVYPLSPIQRAVLADLKAKMFWEIDRNSLGTKVMDAVELDEWSEVGKCWTCEPGMKCGTCGSQVVFDRLAILRGLKGIMAGLPKTI